MSSKSKQLEVLFDRAVTGSVIAKVTDGFSIGQGLDAVMLGKTKAAAIAYLGKHADIVAQVEADLAKAETPQPEAGAPSGESTPPRDDIAKVEGVASSSVDNLTPPDVAGSNNGAGLPDIDPSTVFAISGQPVRLFEVKNDEVVIHADLEPAIERAILRLSLPLPEELVPAMLTGAIVAVTARSERSRMRAGRIFTRTETGIPLADLSAEQLEALGSDPQLSVTVLLPKPA